MASILPDTLTAVPAAPVGARASSLAQTGPRSVSATLRVIAAGLALLTLVALTGAALIGCGSDRPPIVFTSDRDGNLEIYSVRPGGGEQTNLTNSGDDQSAPRVSPDGRLIAFLSGSGTKVGLEVMEMDGTERVQVTLGKGMHRSQRWSPESDRLAYIVNEDGPVLYVGDADGSERVLLTSIPGDEVGDWSSDGNLVAFAVHGGAAQGIYTRNPDGVNEILITETPDYSPIWSPDSRRIAFLSTRDGNPDIYVMEADGSQQRRLTGTEAAEYDISWSPDGRRILFVSEEKGNADIWMVKPDGSKQVRLTENNASDVRPVWSRDGKKITFVSYLDGDAEIFVMDADGSNQVRLTNNDAEDTDPSW